MSDVPEIWDVRFALLFPEARSMVYIHEELSQLPWWERLMVHIWVALP